MSLLEIRNLTVEFPTSRGLFRAVDGIDLSVPAGEVLGVVGESGSGKSVSMLATMGLLPDYAIVRADKLAFDGRDLLSLTPAQRRAIVGKDIAMIFQEPTTSLNPCFTIGHQIDEALQVHMGGSKAQRRERILELLNQVGIPDPVSRLSAYPHQLSGGMNQRIMIAMAISCRPRLLIADEPTTALDVTIQAQIMDLLTNLQRDQNMAMVLITHDMAVVSEAAHRMQVMYAGQVVEQAPVERLFSAPRHPYTAALLNALPEHAAVTAHGGRRQRLPTIPGVVPGIGDRPKGCLFNPRCGFVSDRCRIDGPALRPEFAGGAVRCHSPLDADGKPMAVEAV
ncbi:ABC transporter ATP-binding protein [Elstera cyanobacteriorum]|uniref:ABC transporter ATP-binding protein n=1 Tax=Elstera cyanobacteriorum TaxID=2022747 RepID=UPI002356DF82|nr:ABC transporter ATP-binding protein [Elstera cyanobacteriorum]MCK6441303.1 ABC transporter ATP-binding protein [Elstera cyanobacteriorum]